MGERYRSGELAAAPLPDQTAAHDVPWSQLVFRRRRFLVHRAYQLRVTFLIVGTAFLLLLLLNTSVLALHQRSTAEAMRVAPELQAYFAAQDRFQVWLILVGSGAFLVGVFLVSVLETHRTAGASYNICRCLGRLGEGDYRIRVRLRRGDNLKEIEDAFNDASHALYERTVRESDLLDEWAGRATGISGAAAAELASELRRLADQKRQLLE